MILLWRLLGHRNDGAGDFLLAEPRSSFGLKLAALVVATVSSGIVWAWWQFQPWAYFGESGYFLTRLDLMFLGHLPYRDFDFGYGPAMLYLPFALHQWTGLALDTAHILNVVLFGIAGFLVLYRILCRLDLPFSWSIGLVVAIGVTGFNISLAPIYTPLRFLWAAFSVLEIDLALSKPSCGRLRGSAVPALYCLAGFLISPDTGLQTTFAASAYIAWSSACRRRSDAVLLAGPVLVVTAISTALGPEYFKYVFCFGGGFMNLPIPPAPYILALALAACWVLPILAFRSLRAAVAGRPVAAALTGALGLALPAALGRCDPGHVFWNGLPLFLIAAAMAVRRARPRALFLVCALVLSVTVLASNRHYKALFAEQLRWKSGLESAPASAGQHQSVAVSGDNLIHFPWSKPFRVAAEARQLFKYPRIATPLGCGEDIDKFLKLTGRYAFDRSLDGAASGRDLKMKLEALRHERVVMVRAEVFASLAPMSEASIRADQDFLSRLFVFPVNWRPANEPFSFNNVIAYVIATRYTKIGSFFDYVIMEKSGCDP